MCRFAMQLVLAALVMLPVSARAQVCMPKNETIEAKQAAVKYLRRLSVDLLGHLPSYDDQLKAYQTGQVTDATIDKMLQDPRFTRQMREYFKDLLTFNINDLSLAAGLHLLAYRVLNAAGDNATTKETRWVILDRPNTVTRTLTRGSNIGCLPNKKATWDAKGQLLCHVKGSTTPRPCIDVYHDLRSGKKLIAQEGYVEVHPFWDEVPGRTWRVCAMAARTGTTFVDGKNTYTCTNGVSNHDKPYGYHRLCGCGPNLNWCSVSGEARSGIKTWTPMMPRLLSSMMEQTMLLVDDIVSNDKPYTELLTAKKAKINGPLSHLHLRFPGLAVRMEMASKKELPTIPSIPYHQFNTWKEFDMGSRGAGLLTLPFYTLKYATNRGRLHRYHNAFMCHFFEPPKTAAPGCDPNHPDLTKRCLCQGCHTTIEPEASHWGRWQESAWFPLLPTAFPKYDPKCDPKVTKGKIPTYCKSLYLVYPQLAEEKSEQGKLLSYVFAPTSWDSYINKGPSALVQRDINNGTIGKCGVENMWQWFVGSSIKNKPQEPLYNQLSSDFIANRYSIRSLVKSIVKSEEYRRGYATSQP